MTPETLTSSEALATWGDLFEVAVKRGCLDLLLERGMLPETEHLAPWAGAQVADLIAHLHRQLGVTDPSSRGRHARALQHLLLQGWGLGWTVLRAALDRLEGRDGRVRGLYCPFSLPARPGSGPDEHSHEELWRSLGLPGAPDPAWLGRGQPARADMLLWLIDSEEREHVFVLEFSVNAPTEVRDFGDQEPHLGELLSHALRIESRGIFTRVGAMLTSEHFAFSDRIISHLAALTTRDKPLYKLAQASAYATSFILNLRERGVLLEPVTAHAIAVTNNGVEALEAEFSDPPSPRWSLMRALGEAYPRVPHPRDNDRQALDREIGAVRDQIVRALPASLRDPVEEALDESSPAGGLDLRLAEPIEAFANPAGAVAWDALAAGIDESPALCALLCSESPRAALAADCGCAPTVTLREVHTATLRRAIACAPMGQITVLAAEGMPGIGKTYSVRESLRSQEGGFLWFYASPRLVINEDVLREIALPREGGTPDVVALTTNSRLISGAGVWWRDHRPENDSRRVDGAVLCAGAPVPVPPRGSTLFVDQVRAQEIDAGYSGFQFKKRNLDEGTDEMRPAEVHGVLKTLAGAARDVLERNPSVNRLVLTASIQGFRYLGRSDARRNARTTVERLSNLFHERAGTPAAAVERAEFARRIPTVVVMIDEIAGDGAGAPFVHEMGAWLHREFIAPFERASGPCPFRVVLVLADASLANDEVMRSYLSHESAAPEKVFVSPSRGAVPFRVTAGDLRIGGRQYPALHVMADGFPARSLTVEYHVRLTPVSIDARALAVGTAARTLIAQDQGDRVRLGAAQSVFDALVTLPPGQQVIFFAQDKRLLRAVRAALLHPEAQEVDGLPPLESYGIRLSQSEVAVLDSSVSDKDRKRLTEPAVRDGQRVFLMTSSGARGISFPRAATIIGLVPRFAVESGFMEIAQLVYRGRGGDGDFLDRRLVMLLHDFVVSDGPVDARQWLRRTLDILSALLLLRATILTRVTGDAGLRDQLAAVVPVGRIGADDAASSLSHAVGPFLRECGIYVHDASDPDLRALVDRAQAGVLDLFADLSQVASLPSGRDSVMQREFVEGLFRGVTAEHSWLLDRAHPRSLPSHISAIGPLWLESWSDLPVEESLAFRAQTEAGARKASDLRARLYRIGEDFGRLPRPLTKAARDLRAVLDRPAGLRDMAFRVKRHSQDAGLWVCVPLDYPSFMFVEGEHGRQLRPLDLDAQAIWREAMLRVVSAASPPLTADPVIPRYRASPYLLFQTAGDPTDLDRAFDGRYFMASSELNLLNTILFVG